MNMACACRGEKRGQGNSGARAREEEIAATQHTTRATLEQGEAEGQGQGTRHREGEESRERGTERGTDRERMRREESRITEKILFDEVKSQVI